MPTNVDVKDAVRSRFGEFYVSLFDAVLSKRDKPKSDAPATSEADAPKAGCLCHGESTMPDATGLLVVVGLLAWRRRAARRGGAPDGS